MDIAAEIRARLMAEQDVAYRDFHAKLLPNLSKEQIIGVRTPVLRAIAKEISRDPDRRAAFMRALPHKYYDENTLHGALIASCSDYRQVMDELTAFLPYIDNWATCDLTNPKIFAKHTAEFLPQIRAWLNAEHTYTVRFAVNMLMTYYLGGEFSPEQPGWLCRLTNDDYYVKMAVAWYFATALAKQYDSILPFIEKRSLEPWTHNKAIQKAIESRRITPQQKEYLRALKIK